MQIHKLTADKELTILAGRMIDGTGAEVVGKTIIEIKKGEICSLQKDTEFSNYQTRGQVIDWSEYTVLPGLIDCHVHLALDAIDLNQAIDGWDDIEKVRARVADYLKSYLDNGVLIIRDGSDRAIIGLSAREWAFPKGFYGPYISATGEAIYKKGQYGTFLGPGIGKVSEAEKEIKKLLQYGIDQLKVVQSGLVSFKEYGKVAPPQFNVVELKEIIEIAHGNNLPVMVHVSGAEAIDIAVQAGADSIEHGYFIESATLELMAQKGTAWIPTLSPLGNLVRSGSVYKGASIEVIKQILSEQMSRVKEAWDKGVLLGVGTDAGANQVFHGTSYHQELSFYLEAGLTPIETIKAATNNSAKVLKWDKMMGTIEEKKIPFIIAVKGNPAEDMTALQRIQAIII